MHKNFIFSQDFFPKNKKNMLNHMTFNEEIECYYNFILENKRSEILFSDLLSAIEDSSINGGGTFSFSLLLTLIINHPKKKKNLLLRNNILEKINNKGDLSKFEINEVYSKLDSIIKNTIQKEQYQILENIKMIFIFFKEKRSNLKNLFYEKKERYMIFELLQKYKKIFSKSIPLFPDNSFLIDEYSINFDILKNILNCSVNFSDFISIINLQKNSISKILNNEKKVIILDVIFDMEKIFINALDKSFYSNLYDIKDYERNINNQSIIFGFIYLPKYNTTEENFRKLFFLLFYSITFPKEKLFELLKKKEEFYFLLSISTQDCRNIQELAGEVHGGNNQNFISIEELLSLEKIVETIESIKEFSSNKPNYNDIQEMESTSIYLKKKK